MRNGSFHMVRSFFFVYGKLINIGWIVKHLNLKKLGIKMEKEIEELTLLLLYLTSWKEEDIPEAMRRSWKGYSFDALDQLTDRDYLRGGKKSKSVYLTEAGIEEAKQLMEKYFVGEKKDE